MFRFGTFSLSKERVQTVQRLAAFASVWGLGRAGEDQETQSHLHVEGQIRGLAGTRTWSASRQLPVVLGSWRRGAVCAFTPSGYPECLTALARV